MTEKERKTKLIQAWVTVEEYEEWQVEAQKDRRNLASWLRYVLNLYMRGGEE